MKCLFVLNNFNSNQYYFIPPESSHIKQAFEAEYPKLLRMSADLWSKLQQFHHEISSVSNAGNEYIDEEENFNGSNQFK